MSQSNFKDALWVVLGVIGFMFVLGLIGFLFHSITESRKPTPFKYSETEQGNLFLHLYRPKSWQPDDRRKCVAFLFGGGWETGSYLQFEDHAKALTKEGIVSISISYRTRGKHGTTPFESVQDAQDAIRWIRVNAAQLGVDSEQVYVAGGSAGGQLAVGCAIFPSDETGGRPNGLILMGAVLDLDIEAVKQRAANKEAATSLLKISPLHQLTKTSAMDLPRTLIMHGSNDQIVPVETARAFEEKVKSINPGADIRLVEFKGRSHEFYLSNPSSRADYKIVLRRIINFIEEQRTSR